MAQTANEVIEFKDLSKGLNTFEGDTGVPEGYYVDAQNMALPSKSPETVGGLTKLNTTAAPDSRTVLWFEPFATATTGTHSDVAHSDVSHSDGAHSDAAHADAAHGDVAHSDVAHTDTHSDSHSDAAHSDIAHTDVAHSDGPHSDSHSDVAHGDASNKSHTDTPHSDDHSDVAHSDGPHSDVAHSDVAHSDTHTDTHSDVAHTDSHSDSAHSDTAHSDVAHSDVAHADVAHADSIANAHLIVALDRGAGTDGDGSGIWEYDPNADTWSHLWTYCFTTAGETARYRFSPPYFSSIPFRSRLFWTFSGNNDIRQDIPAATNTKLTDEQVGATSDNPLKHDGLYVSPLGAAAYSFDVASSITGVAPNDQRVLSAEAFEPAMVVHAGAGGTVTYLSTGGNRKDGLRGVQLHNAGVATAWRLTYGTNRDFTTGLLGAPNFGNTDWFVIWFKPAATANHQFDFIFGDNPLANYFHHSTAVMALTAGHWYEYRARRSQFVVGAGAPNFNNISNFYIQNLLAVTQDVVFDAAYWEYNNSPTARGAAIEMYNQQCVLGDIFDAKTSVKYSNVGSPDYFDPAIGVARFDGGRLTLGEQDRVTALWTYFDELIVGKNSSAWTFSGTGANVSISALPLTIGIASQRGIVETPWSLHYYYDGNVFGARLTSRGLVSTNITSLLSTIDVSKTHRTASLRNDPTHTVRWSFRTTASSDNKNDLGLLYDYQLDAWLSKYTPRINHYTQWVNYTAKQREILVSMYDGNIYRADVGTDFAGTPIASYVTLPWTQPPQRTASGKSESGVMTQRIMPYLSNVVQWMDVTAYLKGTADVIVEARFADEPHEFNNATFTSFGTIQATPDGDKGYVYLGKTSRWIQLRFRATALSFQLTMPVLLGYNVTARRV